MLRVVQHAVGQALFHHATMAHHQHAMRQKPCCGDIVGDEQHGEAELVAAFHRKLREGALPLRSYRAVFAQFECDRAADAFRWLPAGPTVLEMVREVYADLPRAVFLRGADALHLATASVNGLKSVYSHDRHFLAAAGHFGLKGVNVVNATPRP